MNLKRIDQLFNFEKGILQSSKCIPGKYDFITASSDWKTHNEYTHNCEALIFAAAASGSLGRTHYVCGKFIASDLCFIITPKDQKRFPIDLKFYHILFNELKDEIVRNTKAGTSKEAIGLGSFGKYLLPYFNIETQVKIKGHFVSSEKIQKTFSSELNQQTHLVRKLRRQLFQDAVQGKLVSQNKEDEPAIELLRRIKDEKLRLIAKRVIKKEKELTPINPMTKQFYIPKSWEWCRLGEICTKIGSGSTPKGSNYSSEGIPFFRSQNIYNSGLVYDDIKYIADEVHLQMNGTRVYANDLLLNITGGSMGRCALVPNDFEEGNVSQHVCIIRPLLVENRFFHFIIQSPFFQDFIFSSTTGAGREGLPKYNLEQFIIPIPPLAEQKRIVQKLDQLMRYCDDLEESINAGLLLSERLLHQNLKEILMKES